MQNVFNIRLITVLVVSTVLIMSIFVGVRFYYSKLDFEKSLELQIDRIASRIAAAVKPSIWSIYSKSIEREFSEEFASGVLDSELLGEYVVGIVVYGQFGHVYMGKYKDEDGAILRYRAEGQPINIQNSDLTRSFPIRLNSMTLGKVKLFIDTQTYAHKQKDTLIIEVVQIGLVSIFFVLVLYYTIKRALFAPLGHLQVARKTFDSMAEAIVFTDEYGVIYGINPAFNVITGLSRANVINRSVDSFFPGKFDEINLVEAANLGHSTWSGETECQCDFYRSIPVWLTISAVNASSDDSSRKSEYVFVFQDISSRKEAESKLEKLAFFDVLTDLPNRQYFENELENSIQLAGRASEPIKLSLIFLDLDNFKHINDSMGHTAGDDVLVEVARRFKSRIRDADFLARMGGDEFTIIVRDISDSQQAATLARDLNDVANETIVINDIEFRVGASIGISIYPDDASSASELVKNADIAMYNAKEQGKGQFSFYSRDLNDKVANFFELRNKIDLAILNNEFELYYQPKVDLFKNKIIAAEALIRWIPGDGDIIRPDIFIPMAEETRQIVPIGKWVIEEAVNQLAKWQNTKFEQLAISINLSPIQLYDEDLIEYLQSVLQTSKVNPALVEIEITESAIIQDADSAIEILSQIKKLGVKLSLDDFGTGYSSLSYLRMLPVDILKIDRSFLSGAEQGNVSSEILNYIIKLAEALSIDVVAEGIEDKQHLDLLKSQNCRLGQGYYFSPPVTIEEFEKFELNLLHSNLGLKSDWREPYSNLNDL